MSDRITVSFSEVDAYRQCGLKHQLLYQEQWGAEETSVALSRGSLWHSVMEMHYTMLMAGMSLSYIREEVVAEWLPDIDDKQQQLVEWMYDGYVAQWGEDERWEILGVEKRFEAQLPESDIWMAGTVDLLVRDKSMAVGSGLFIVDHKTCRNLPSELEIDLDDQASIYTYLLRKRGLDIRGHIRSAARTEKLKTREMTFDERFLRRLTVRTETELETMVCEVRDLMEQAYGRNRKRDAPRSPDPDRCRWRCPLTEPCLMGRKGADMRAVMEDFGFEVKETKPGPTFAKT